VAAATSSPTPGAECVGTGPVMADPPLLGRALEVDVGNGRRARPGVTRR
jgi:hypothetical protein